MTFERHLALVALVMRNAEALLERTIVGLPSYLIPAAVEYIRRLKGESSLAPLRSDAESMHSPGYAVPSIFASSPPRIAIVIKLRRILIHDMLRKIHSILSLRRRHL